MKANEKDEIKKTAIENLCGMQTELSTSSFKKFKGKASLLKRITNARIFSQKYKGNQDGNILKMVKSIQREFDQAKAELQIETK